MLYLCGQEVLWWDSEARESLLKVILRLLDLELCSKC